MGSIFWPFWPSFSSCDMAWACTQQQSRPSLMAAAHGLGCVDSLLCPCSTWVVTRDPHPTTAQPYRMVGCFCQGLYSMCWDLWLTLGEVLCVRWICFPTDLLELLCSRDKVPVSMTSSSYPSGRHSSGLISIVNSDWISVLVKEMLDVLFFFFFFFFKWQKEVFYLNI